MDLYCERFRLHFRSSPCFRAALFLSAVFLDLFGGLLSARSPQTGRESLSKFPYGPVRALGGWTGTFSVALPLNIRPLRLTMSPRLLAGLFAVVVAVEAAASPPADSEQQEFGKSFGFRPNSKFSLVSHELKERAAPGGF